MSRPVKITLPDPTAERLEHLAEQTGEPLAALVMRLVQQQLEQGLGQPGTPPPRRTVKRSSRRAPAWLEPREDGRAWRAEMWASIVALHERYPQQLAGLQDGWWEHHAQHETLAALVVWRRQLDQAGSDPREELLFHSHLEALAETLRGQGRGVASVWKPDAPPQSWAG